MAALFPKKAGVIAIRILIGGFLFAGFLLWLLGTEPALRWGAQQAEYLTNGKLTIHDVHGSLYGPLRIGSLSFQNEEQRYELKEANLDWTPFSLLKWRIQADLFTVQELRLVELKPATEPVRLPETLDFPISFSVQSIRVDRLVLKRGDTEHVLSGIDLGVSKLAADYQLNLRTLTSAWGKGQAEIMLGDTRPFSISAHISLQQTEGVAYRTEADASGNLTQILLKARANVLGGQAKIDAKLTPFEEMPLAAAHIAAGHINPALLGKGSPQADISLLVSLERKGVENLDGKVMLRNDLPGPWDQARLSFREIKTRLAGTLGHLDLLAIHLDLAGAGEFKGEGAIKDRQLQLNLTTASFNPRGVLNKLHPMRLAGDIHLQAEPNSQRLAADLRDQHFQLHLDAYHQNAVLELRQATIQSGTGKLTLHGTLALQGIRRFELAGALQGFNPADFGDYPTARVNASFSGTGQLAVEPQATLGFAIADSQFRHQPLSGQGNLSVSAKHIWNSELQLRLARNRVEAKGALGSPGDQLSFQIEAENLAMFDPELGGTGHAKGILEGRFSAPSGNVEAQISNLSWRKHYRVASFRAMGRLEQGADGRLALDATLQGVHTPQLHLDHASLNAQGTRIRHTLQFQAKNADFDVESQLAGGWQDASGWSGQVTELVNRGRHKFVLKSPAKLELAKQRMLLSDARFDIGGANLVLHSFDYATDRVTSRGEFKGLSLDYLQGFADESADFQTDLALGGEWQFAVHNSVNGHVALWRERGDVSLSRDEKTGLGLNRLALNVDVVNNRFQSRMEAAGSNLGSLRADALGMLSARDGVWGIAGDAPLQASLDLTVESLAWMQPLLGKPGTLAFDGAVKAQLHAAGTFAQPSLTGAISGERFSFALPEQGLHFTAGRFQAELKDRTMHLHDLVLRGGDGKLSGQGQLAFAGGSPVMQLSLKADKLEVLSRPDRHLILSGTSDVSVARSEVRVAAKLKADRGLIELPKNDAPTSSDDVVVLGRTTAEDKKRLPPSVNFDLDLDLGEHFFVKGKGLDAQLGGTLKLTSMAGAQPSSRGSIRVVKGSYSAYGQRLEIERGILNFQGPLDNPGLNILALRKNQPVEAGVAVTGTAQAPRVNLVSNPSLPDSQTLSWLVLGHGIDDASQQEFNALQVAAGALLAAGESISLQQKIAHAGGLDEVSLKGAGGLESTVLTLGKKLSSRAYLSYEQGLASADTLVKINYTLTKRFSVRVQAGAIPGVDLFYTFSYD